jgi:TrmH family RNA methyltransferase
MPVINSLTNFRVLQWQKLKNKAHRDKQGLFIAEGYHLVSEAYKANSLMEVITAEKNGGFGVKTYQVTYDVMEKLTSLATPTKYLGICRQKGESAYGNNLLLIDQIHHPGNLGTIIRNAAAFGVDTVVVEKSADIYNQKVIQSTQGMVFHVNIIKRNLGGFIAELKEQGYQIIGTDVREGTPLHTVKPDAKRAVLLGSESAGVNGALMDVCDIKVNIKMNGKCESLNVGVAAGIILYQLSLK